MISFVWIAETLCWLVIGNEIQLNVWWVCKCKRVENTNNLIHSVRDKHKVILSVRGKPSNLVLLVRVKEINFIAIKQGRVKGINYSRIKGQEISHTIKEIPTIKVQ